MVKKRLISVVQSTADNSCCCCTILKRIGKEGKEREGRKEVKNDGTREIVP